MAEDAAARVAAAATAGRGAGQAPRRAEGVVAAGHGLEKEREAAARPCEPKMERRERSSREATGK